MVRVKVVVMVMVMVMVMGYDAGTGCPRHPRLECAGSFQSAGGWCRVCEAGGGPPGRSNGEIANPQVANGKFGAVVRGWMRGRLVVVVRSAWRAAWKRKKEGERCGSVPVAGTRTCCAFGKNRRALGRAGRKSGATLQARPTARDGERASVWQSGFDAGGLRRGVGRAWGRPEEREMKEVVGMVPEDGTMAFCAAGGIRCALGWAGMKSGETLGASLTTRDSERATVWQSCNGAGGLGRCVWRAWDRPGRDREDK